MFTILALIACSDSGLTALSATDELTLSAASTKEEVLVDGEDAAAASMPEREAPPPPFSECDALGRFEDLRAEYDSDGDGTLSADEEQAVLDAREERGDPADRHMQGLWHMLGLVYDLDESHSLDDTERRTMLEDMTVRCDALQAQLLAEFDTDGDGVLSEDELAVATSEAEAAFEEGHDQTCPGMEGGGAEGGGRPEGEGAPPEGGGEPPEFLEGGDRAVPPPFVEFDTDGDGLLSDSELTTLRETMRERIRSGEPLVDAFAE